MPHSSDTMFMQRALRLAQGVRGHVWPNPPVGCVIVKDNLVISEAATHPGGRPHAERKALDEAGSKAVGATLYVTLEPCCHWGKTPPCADAIVAAGITRVVCAVQDPDPRVNGGGFSKLQDAGLQVTIGICKKEAEALMSGFFHRIHFGAPELLPLSGPIQQIREGVDAVLLKSPRGWTLKSRNASFDALPQSPDALMRWMGALGLTTVAISDEDPLSRHHFASPSDMPHLQSDAADVSALRTDS